MRTHGTLIKWNDDRGFGFIEPAAGGAEIFVHISAFPHDGRRPHVGELVSYEIESRQDGKPQATHVMRPAIVPQSRRPRTTPTGNHQRGQLISLGSALLLLAIAAYVYFSQSREVLPTAVQTIQTVQPTQPTQLAQPAAVLVSSTAPTPLFNCDGRTRCPQMKSCAEAKYFLNHCPGTKMDGNHDGVPCQRQWCNASHGD